MKICLWNIDCPEFGSKRFSEITSLINDGEFDLIVTLEGNSALPIVGYQRIESSTIPYFNKGRNYNYPNHYAQVILYSKINVRPVLIEETVNNIAVDLENGLRIYSNIITIKDRWIKSNSVTYKDRFRQQIRIMDEVIADNCIILGDFNFKLRTLNNSISNSYSRFYKFVKDKSLIWATDMEKSTVQHIVHSANINLSYKIIDVGKLSDHPLIKILIEN